MPFEEKRGIVETVVQRIVIGKEDIEITFFYEPTLSRNDGLSRQNPIGFKPQPPPKK